MGNFYTNYTFKGASAKDVAAAFEGRKAVITPEVNGYVVAFDEESDSQDMDVINQLASKASKELGCPVLAVMNHDDDILWFRVYEGGELRDEYDSTPGYFDGDELAPAGGDAEGLCRIFGGTDADEVERMLRKSALEEGGYVFAFERHADLARALGMPEFGVGMSYESFEGEGLPEGLSRKDLIRVG